MDAYRHLAEWPASLRDTAHSMALKACSAALRGEIEAETARGLFAAFAEKHDLLAPENDAIAASHLRRDKELDAQRSPRRGLAIVMTDNSNRQRIENGSV